MQIPGSCKFALVFVQVRPVRTDNALTVAHHDVFLSQSETHIHLRASNGSRPCAVHDKPHILYLLPGNLKRVQKSRGADDGRPVLIVVHKRDIDLLLESPLYLEALRSLDILKIDSAESRCYVPYRPAELVHIGRVHLDVNRIHAGQFLEQHSFAFHHWLPGKSADVPKSEHCRPVRDYGNEIPLACVVVRLVGVGLYLKARSGYSRCICKRKIVLVFKWFCWLYLKFSRRERGMIFQRLTVDFIRTHIC